MDKNLIKKILVEISRVILGITFMFSGFVKAVDPYGTAYKIEDYLMAFNLPSLTPLAFLASCILCLFEFIMGAFMVFGIYRKWNSRLILLTMLFMTPLTLYLAIADPVADCGCFGDALVITNWQTFYKNIVLLVCAIIAVIYCEKISNFFTGKTYWMAFFFIIIVSILFVFRNYLFEPIFDFRPYKIGTNISDAMSVESGKGRVEETILVYSKDGVEKEFTDQNAPWEDESWEFVRMDTKLVSEGQTPAIVDFTIAELEMNREGSQIIGNHDITEQVLSDTNYVFLMISPLFSKMHYTHLSHFEDVADYAREYNYGFYCLTATGPDEIIQWAKTNVIDFTFCNMDERTLKTIVRSNPGLLLLKKGEIINKWADIEVPAEEDLIAPIDELEFGQKIDVAQKDKKNFIYVSAVFILPLLLLKFLDFISFGRIPIKIGRKKNEDKNEKN